MSKRHHGIFTILAFILFLIIGVMVRNSASGVLFDVSLMNAIHTIENQVVFSIMKFISFIGSGYFLFPAVGVAFIYAILKKKYYISKLLLVSSLGCWMVNHLLKLVFNRTRPLDFFLVQQGGLSYPSGHSMVSMSMYLTFAYLLCRSDRFKDKKRLVYALALTYVLIMGLSRLYLGVHWPTDIIGGFAVGFVYFNTVVISIKE